MAILEQDKSLQEDRIGDDVLLNAFQPEEHGLPATDVSVVKAAAPQFFPLYVINKLNELRFIKFAFASFVINNLRRRYQRSVLGFAWSMLNPLLMMIVLTTIFSLLFHRDPKSFGIYMFTGLLPWQFLSESIANGCTAIVGAEAFMKKVYVPKLFLPLVTCTTEGVNFVLALISMMAIALFVGLKLTWSLLLLPFAFVITYVFAFGIVLSLGVATVYFRDMTHLVKVILQSFFYFIPIIWPMSALPKQYVGWFLANPFTHFILLFRSIIFDGTAPTAHCWKWSIFYALTSCAIGFWILRRNEKDIIFRL